MKFIVTRAFATLQNSYPDLKVKEEVIEKECLEDAMCYVLEFANGSENSESLGKYMFGLQFEIAAVAHLENVEEYEEILSQGEPIHIHIGGNFHAIIRLES